MKKLKLRLTIVLLACCMISCTGSYKTEIILRFEGDNTYKIDKRIFHDGEVICMQWYTIKTDNIDSVYQAEIVDCDSIITKHKHILANVQ